MALKSLSRWFSHITTIILCFRHHGHRFPRPVGQVHLNQAAGVCSCRGGVQLRLTGHAEGEADMLPLCTVTGTVCTFVLVRGAEASPISSMTSEAFICGLCRVRTGCWWPAPSEPDTKRPVLRFYGAEEQSRCCSRPSPNGCTPGCVWTAHWRGELPAPVEPKLPLLPRAFLLKSATC